ncbi:hypothetical protein CMU19_04510 [Elizabethkingia anophelis]|nr:hypothetical protein [Elizabethkingia anophelis]
MFNSPLTYDLYPYSLFILKTTGGGKDDDGFPIPVTKDWQELAPCRDQPAGSGNIISTISGEVTNYSSVIYVPIDTELIEANSQIEVRSGSTVRLRANVIRFSKERLHCRIWV